MTLSGIDVELLLYDDLAMSKMTEFSSFIRLGKKNFAERYRRCITSATSDLFHSSYYRLPQSKKIPSITTVHDFIYERFNSGPRRWVHSSQKYKAIKEAAAVICISENTKKDLFEFMPDIVEKKVRVVHNGVGNSYFPLQMKVKPSTQRPYVLFIGSRVTYKNFAVAVNSLSLLTDIDLVCVGGGEFTESERRTLETIIPNRYRHEGIVNDERLNYLYNDAICLIYPSSYEGFGIPVLEAMRAGCPVIALNSSSIPEVAGNAAVLLERPEPDLISKAIEQLLDHEFRQGIQQKGFIQSSLFSWDNCFNNTIKLYEEVLGHSLLHHLI